MARDIVAEAIAKAPEHCPFTENGRIQLHSRKLSCDFSGRSFYNRGKPYHWCWQDSGWRLADVGLATEKTWLLVLYQDIDLSELKSEQQHLTDVAIVWQDTGVSGSNFGDLKEFFRCFLRSDVWNRSERISSSEFKLQFELVFSETVLAKLKNGKIPKYLDKILERRLRDFGNSKSIYTKKINHPMIGKLEKILSNQDVRDFGLAFMGGKNNCVREEEHILPSIWLELIGDQPIPLNFEDRRKAFPNAFDELGKRIDYHRTNLKK